MTHLTSCLCLLAIAGGPWRTYEVYQPRVERVFVNDAHAQSLKYNHDSSIAWFGDRWFCLWNANEPPREGAPGQLNYVSTSRDGRAWSDPAPVFACSELSVNPIPCPTGTQWQPNLIVVDGELWAVWDHNSRDEYNGCYVSRLDAPEGKWRNERLLWDGEPRFELDGRRWRVFPTQNPIRLRCGRVLAPVTLIGDRAADSPEEFHGWKAAEKRNSVLYTDDGRSWHFSPGAIQPGRSWAQWEPTVWELDDGTVMMFARNNDFRWLEKGGPPSTEMLLWSKSTDRGETWTPHEYVPLETVCSRMHVLPAGGDRFMMVHNDFPAGQFVSDRRNLALFFTRGAGFDFVAGPGLTDHEPVVAYPQMWIRENGVAISYSQGRDYRSIRAAHVHPLPDPQRYYLFPRAGLIPGERPDATAEGLRFDGNQQVTSRAAIDSGGDRFSVSAWVLGGSRGTLLDCRSTAPQGGFVWLLSDRRVMIHLGTPEGNIVSSLQVNPDRWNYLGVSVDNRAGSVTFYVNDAVEMLPFTAPAPNPLRGATARIGSRRFESSQVPGLAGQIRMLWLYLETIGPENHRALYNEVAGQWGYPLLDNAELPALPPTLYLDPVDTQRLTRDFVLPGGVPGGVEVRSQSDGTVATFHPAASAGLDLDENDRRRGDSVELEFRFRPLAPGNLVALTVGDANEPARLRLDADLLRLCRGDLSVPVGRISEGAWGLVRVRTAGMTTEVSLNDGDPAVVRHEPQGTWVYFGEGYRTSAGPSDASFEIDVNSIRSRVLRAPQ